MVFRICLHRFFLTGLFAALLGALPLGPAPTSLGVFLGQVPPQEKQNQSEENDEGVDQTALAQTRRHLLIQLPRIHPDRHVPMTSLRPEPIAVTLLHQLRMNRELPRRTTPPSSSDDDPDDPDAC